MKDKMVEIEDTKSTESSKSETAFDRVLARHIPSQVRRKGDKTRKDTLPQGIDRFNPLSDQYLQYFRDVEARNKKSTSTSSIQAGRGRGRSVLGRGSGRSGPVARGGSRSRPVGRGGTGCGPLGRGGTGGGPLGRGGTGGGPLGHGGSRGGGGALRGRAATAIKRGEYFDFLEHVTNSADNTAGGAEKVLERRPSMVLVTGLDELLVHTKTHTNPGAAKNDATPVRSVTGPSLNTPR